MLKKISLLFFLITLTKTIKFLKRQNSKKCTYKLKIEKIQNQDLHHNSENHIKFELKISEKFQLENPKNQNKKKIDEYHFQKIEVIFENTELNLDKEKNYFDLMYLKLRKYNFLFDNKILYYKNLKFKMSPNERFFVQKKNNDDFIYEIYNLPCELELPLISYKSKDLRIEEKTEEVFSEVYYKYYNIFYDFDFIFEINALNKFHLFYEPKEFEQILKKNKFDKFKSFQNQVF